jgi:hypothetical protein
VLAQSDRSLTHLPSKGHCIGKSLKHPLSNGVKQNSAVSIGTHLFSWLHLTIVFSVT